MKLNFNTTQRFSKTALFSYNYGSKIRFVLLLSLLIASLITFILLYLLVFKNSTHSFFIQMQNIVTHIQTQIAIASIEGILYTAIFGGLFFVTLPMEAIFIAFLTKGASPYLVIPLFVGGFVISYTANYFIGLKLDVFSKKIITPKKFYQVKGILNRRGSLAIFLINCIPLLPSQPLSTILGVFKYNKKKFYLYFISGQLLKFIVISAGYTYVI